MSNIYSWYETNSSAYELDFGSLSPQLLLNHIFKSRYFERKQNSVIETEPSLCLGKIENFLRKWV